MNLSMHDSLQTFLTDKIEPNFQRMHTKKAHLHIRGLVGEKLGDKLVTDFVMGSYRRHTLTRRLKPTSKYDVDVLFVLQEDHELEELLNTMEDVAKEIVDEVEDIKEYRRQKVSIGLRYKDNFSIDLVPAVAADDGNYILYDSAELKPISTNPLRHHEFIKTVNIARNKQLKPLIKLIKRWAQEVALEADHGVFKSFHLEMMAAQLFEDQEFSDYLDGLNQFFAEAYRITKDSVKVVDPVGGGDIASYLDSPDNPRRQEAIDALKKAKDAVADVVRHEDDGDTRLAKRAMGRIYEHFNTDSSTAATISSTLISSNAPKPWSE
jgi:hypothetical protein